MDLIAYLDIDGVIAQFIKAACEAHGQPHEVHKWNFFEQWGINENQFWDKCRGRDFWFNIEKYPEADEIVELVDYNFKGRWRFMSTPSDDNEAYLGKADWITKHFPKFKRKLTITANKEDFASHNKVLIDDSEDNVHKFMDAGGKAILYPRPWNRYRDIKNTIQYVRNAIVEAAS